MCCLDKLDELNMPILFSKISKNFNKKFGDYLKTYGLSKIQAFYLVCLYKNDQGLTLNQLNDMTGCDKANTSRAISDMEVKGIVDRNNKDIEKKYGVYLTDKGKEITSEFVQAIKLDIKESLTVLTSEEVNVLQNIIKKLLPLQIR